MQHAEHHTEFPFFFLSRGPYALFRRDDGEQGFLSCPLPPSLTSVLCLFPDPQSPQQLSFLAPGYAWLLIVIRNEQ